MDVRIGEWRVVTRGRRISFARIPLLWGLALLWVPGGSEPWSLWAKHRTVGAWLAPHLLGVWDAWVQRWQRR